MKRIFFLLLITGWMIGVEAKGKIGKIEFEKTSFEFGTFDQRTVRTCVFTFKNTGNAPVVINQALASCNCTTAQFKKQPIFPGQKGYITIIYNGKNYNKGYFKKNVDVRSNAENGLVRLFISGSTK